MCGNYFDIMPSFSLQKLRWAKETVRVRTKDTVFWSNKNYFPATFKDLQQIMEIMPAVNTTKFLTMNRFRLPTYRSSHFIIAMAIIQLSLSGSRLNQKKC